MPTCDCGAQIQSGQQCRECTLADRYSDGPVGGEADDWAPEPAELREGETRDDDNSHASVNERQVEMLSDGGDQT